MRESRNVLEIQNQRTPLLQKLINETRLLTGAARAQIYCAVNAYHDATINGADGSTRSAELNEKEGVLARSSHHRTPTLLMTPSARISGSPREWQANVFETKSMLSLRIEKIVRKSIFQTL